MKTSPVVRRRRCKNNKGTTGDNKGTTTSVDKNKDEWRCDIDNEPPPKREAVIRALQKDVCSDARLMGELRRIRPHLRVFAIKLKTFDEGLLDRFDEAFPNETSGTSGDGNPMHGGRGNNKKKNKRTTKNSNCSSGDSSFSPDDEKTKMFATLIVDFHENVQKWINAEGFTQLRQTLPLRTREALSKYEKTIPRFYEASERTAKMMGIVDRHNAMRNAVGLATKSLRPRTDPDVPPCESCSKRFSGTLICGRCQSAFYCSVECQRSHWKEGHKKECDAMRENCRRTGREVVDFLNTEFPDTEAVDKWTSKLSKQLHRLDAVGPYKEAVRAGLYDALRRKMQHEMVSLDVTEPLMTILFRGDRVEGKEKGRASNCTSTMDGCRIKGYVKSSPDAFEVWFEATLGRLELIVHPSLMVGSKEHLYFHEAASCIINGWTHVFQTEKAAKAILLPTGPNGESKSSSEDGAEGGEYDEVTLRRCRFIVQALRKWANHIWEGGEERDPTRKIDFYLMVVCAMVAEWFEEFNIPLDMSPKSLGLDGRRLEAQVNSVIPYARDRIRKGSSIDA